MARIGGEIEQLSDLRVAFEREAENVEQLAQRIRSQLSNTAWEGPAADRMRSAWSHEFEPSLTRLQTALDEAGGEVARRRDALLQAGS